jgi:primary-amine oxidase
LTPPRRQAQHVRPHTHLQGAVMTNDRAWLVPHRIHRESGRPRVAGWPQRVARAIALIAGFALAQGAGGVVLHPMDPLEDTEILAAASVLLAGGAAHPGAIFQSIDLREPPKAAVLGFHAGDPIARAATVYFRQDKRSYRSVVDLGHGTFTPPVQIPRSDGQLGLTITEVSDFTFAFADPAFLAALARRGLTTPAQLANVLVTPLTPGSFGLPEESRRIVKAQMYYRDGAAINLYARPIEGMQAVMDLDDRVVLQVIDTGAVPIPPLTHEFDEATVAARYGLRPALKPIVAAQPQGVNFTLDGNFVNWQKWRFHLRFERRPGTVVSLVTYDGRPVLYQGSLAEIFVPYQDPDTNWYYRTYMDAGEFGFGLLSSPLTRGLDVPATAVLRDALVSAAIPDPSVPVVPLPLANVVGIFERLTGNPAWRHFELFAGPQPAYEGRAEVELVVRSISQLGNYDYMVDWVFNQSGAIRVDVSLTGIDAPKGVRSTTLASPGAASQTRYGALVAPNLVAPNHSHHFNFRLDLDVDGPDNSFLLGRLRTQDNVSGPRRSVWMVDDQRLDRERDGQLDEDHALWKVVNPGRINARGYNTGYLVESHDHADPLLRKADFRRAGFIDHALWITRFNPDQRFASGDTPNQNPGEPGLPNYQDNNQSIVNTDLVLWLTIGHHHVTATEDWPVLSRETMSFRLKPVNFFDRNPALDLRRAPFESP